MPRRLHNADRYRESEMPAYAAPQAPMQPYAAIAGMQPTVPPSRESFTIEKKFPLYVIIAMAVQLLTAAYWIGGINEKNLAYQQKTDERFNAFSEQRKITNEQMQKMGDAIVKSNEMLTNTRLDIANLVKDVGSVSKEVTTQSTDIKNIDNYLRTQQPQGKR